MLGEFSPRVLAWLTAAGILVSVVLAGLVVRAVLSHRLRRLTRATAVRWDDALLSAARGVFLLWLVLLGLAAALKTAPLPVEAAALLRRAIGILAILTVALFFVRLARGLITIYFAKAIGMPTTIFRSLAVAIIYILGFLVVLDYVGISIAPIITALGIGGLAVALALQDTLSNLFAGLSIMMSRKIRPGDYVRIDAEHEGRVTDIAWRYTTVRMLSDDMIVVPNKRLAEAIVTNFDLPGPDMSVLLQVGVAFDSDLERVEAVTREVAREVLASVPGGVGEFDPFIRYNAFGESAIRFTVILRCRSFVDQFLVKHEFIKRLQERYRREGIVIPYPIRTVLLETVAGESR